VLYEHSKNDRAFYCGIKFYHRIADPDLVRARQVAMEAARQRLQAELDEKAKLHAEKVKQVCNNNCM
jgi:hypothetical protein